MKVTKFPVGNYGIIIDGLDLDNMTSEEWQEIGKLHLQNLVTVVRGSKCSVDKFSELIHQWGPEFWGLKYSLLKKYKLDWPTFQSAVLADLPIIEQVDKDILDILYQASITTDNGKSVNFFSSSKDSKGDYGLYGGQELDWHMHSSGNHIFEPAVSLLAAKNVVGTATGFVNTADYYENVSNSFRSELDDMRVLHWFAGADVTPPFKPSEEAVLRFKMCPHDDTELPMIVCSPGGIRGLHFAPPTMSSISGASAKESHKIFDAISKELFTDKYIYDHWYAQDGDFMTFDNSITLHRRIGQTENRKIYRIEHTYDNLLDSFYEPFYQEEYASKHRKAINQIMKLEKNSGFIKPPFKFKDLL
jgi:alpha-ketoglutarate-dependent taurine dioxygenase